MTILISVLCNFSAHRFEDVLATMPTPCMVWRAYTSSPSLVLSKSNGDQVLARVNESLHELSSFGDKDQKKGALTFVRILSKDLAHAKGAPSEYVGEQLLKLDLLARAAGNPVVLCLWGIPVMFRGSGQGGVAFPSIESARLTGVDADYAATQKDLVKAMKFAEAGYFVLKDTPPG